jgi:two-component system chemotaxis response regulator CheY
LTVSLEKVRFLIVDDNAHMLDIVKTILRGFGATFVFEAKNAKEAIFRLRHDAIDIIILDYLLGDEDGVALLRRLRHEPDSPASFTPVIMLTAHSDKARVEAARDAGVSEFCAKPVTAAELMKKVGAVIDHPRPFVKGDAYSGPDRRRRDDPDFEGDERRKDRLESDKPPEGEAES